MIPKIIHYCWLSDDPFPELIQRCIDSWKRHLPDYEIMLWNFDRFPRGKSKWVDQAFDSHKYAFAADYIRLYALYNYGGIYLDSDVEVLKSFDDLLNLPYFIGQENTLSGIEAATIGCEKGNLLIKDLLDSYEGRDFANKDGSFNTQPLPFIFRKCIEARYVYNNINGKRDFDINPNVINVFPIDWFSPKHWSTKELNVSNNTYSIHHFAGSWLETKVKEEAKEAKEDKSVTLTRERKPLLLRLRTRLGHYCRRKAVSNRYFAQLYFRLYKREVFQQNSSLIIYKTDYPLICKLDKALIDCEVEFIRKEDSRHQDKIKDFYPIMRIKGSQIEIHPYYYDQCFYTAKQCLELLKIV